ncbi:MAG: radical SAM protein [Candidatus Brocadiaceae bacterium]|nr:radical SAM protein [Candidatus Brocadiaceae bacterium]
MNGKNTKKKFFVELIKPSHYDDEGYVIQWWRSWIPSNSLACLYGLTLDAANKKTLGDDVEFSVNVYDEMNTVIPIKEIIRKFKRADGSGIVCMVGVQTNQFPRAIDIANQFRDENIQVAIGGFHVSGCIAMLPELPKELKEATDNGITLFAGEAEDGRLANLYADVYHKRLKPIYNYLGDLPCMEGQITPLLPKQVNKKLAKLIASFDAGRGCSFLCSFCTVINVQGRKSRFRTADDVEKMVRANLAQGVDQFFFTDDNFARNKNWEPILDRLIDLRENQGLGRLKITMQVDALSYKIKNFVSKAARAGCKRAFVGLENINPENLASVKKQQNRISEYKTMFQTWRNARIVTYSGYILGFPADTPESIERDIKTVQEELPVDLLEFFFLTPLPGSEDHKNLYLNGTWMDPDLNRYDLEHAAKEHPNMSRKEWEDIYQKAWDIYYSPEHVKTLLRRAAASGANPSRVMLHIFQFYGIVKYQKIHPLQGGFLRRKIRNQRRPGMPIENRLIFFLRRAWGRISITIPLSMYFLKLRSIRKEIKSDPERRSYTDKALTPVTKTEEDQEDLLKEKTTITP